VDINNPNYRLVYDDEIRVYENTDVLPRAFVVPEVMAGWTDLDLALRSLNPRQQLILDGETNGLGRDLTPAEAQPTPAPIEAATGPASLSMSAQVIQYTPNQVWVSARLDRPGWLVLADTYFPGWRLTPPGGRGPDTDG